MMLKERVAVVTGLVGGSGARSPCSWPVRGLFRIHHDEGWTVTRLAEIALGTLQHHFVPLETSAQYFNYDPLV
jgi:hypothetical protein